MIQSIYLFGNPNCGKTTVFNQLTGLNQKISNYPGITVEKKMGSLRLSHDTVNVIDFPGTYSLNPTSPDEKIVIDSVRACCREKRNKSKLIISIVDASNLARNLFLTTQLIDTGIPIILAINKIDMIKNIEDIDIEKLKKRLGVIDIVLMSAKNKIGISDLIDSLNAYNSQNDSVYSNTLKYNLPDSVKNTINPLASFLIDKYLRIFSISLIKSHVVFWSNSAVGILLPHPR